MENNISNLSIKTANNDKYNNFASNSNKKLLNKAAQDTCTFTGTKKSDEKSKDKNLFKTAAAAIGLSGVTLAVGRGVVANKLSKVIKEAGEAPVKTLFGKIKQLQNINTDVSNKLSTAINDSGEKPVTTMLGKINQLKNISITDKLTGLYNKRYLENNLPVILKDSTNKKQPLSLMYCDLDYFKRINDVQGHDIGDKALELFSSCVQTVLKKNNLEGNGFRFGGEEFIVSMPGLSKKQAVKVAEQIQTEYSEHPQSAEILNDFMDKAKLDLEKHTKSQNIYEEMEKQVRANGSIEKQFSNSVCEDMGMPIYTDTGNSIQSKSSDYLDKSKMSERFVGLLQDKVDTVKSKKQRDLIHSYINFLKENPDKFNIKLKLTDDPSDLGLNSIFTSLYRRKDEINNLNKWMAHNKMSVTAGLTEYKPQEGVDFKKQADALLKEADNLLLTGKDSKRGEIYLSKD